MKYTINRAHWRVPSEARAFDGWLEGRPTRSERTAILAEVAASRENWTPNSEAWSQLRDLERFTGQRVRIQFWDPTMHLLEDEGPDPVLADCQGIVLLRREGFLQAYLILDRVEELPNSSGFLKRDCELGCTLAPIAELLEIEDEYFDTRRLNPPTSSRDLACPVKSCMAKLPRRIGQRMPLCPVHKIKIHTNTFVYADRLRNIRFEHDYFKRAILRVNSPKAETHRLGYENSEDAVTWNVFAALARRNQLSALSCSLFQVDADEEPELYLWGLRINLDGPVPEKQFDALCTARGVFESKIRNWLTEPDIMLYLPNRFLILVEAKFTSGNTIANPGANDVPGEMPRTREGILRRYNRPDRLPTGSLLTPTKEAPLFSQLYRNLVFAIHMADQLKVQWGLVNLTTKRAYEEMSADLTTFTNAVLPPENRQRFVRYTWEQLFHDHVEGRGDLHELSTYLQFKSANRRPAFEV